MQAGKLRHRITLQQATESQDDLGQVTLSWSDYQDLWASVEPLSGREYMDAKQIQAGLTTRIIIRYWPGVTEQMRVVWTDPADVDHVYDIDSVIADPTHAREMMLMCSEVMS